MTASPQMLHCSGQVSTVSFGPQTGSSSQGGGDVSVAVSSVVSVVEPVAESSVVEVVVPGSSQSSGQLW